mmetsp:Transcript_67704/g.189572  ORF Transcript_67704/g.189572 Transcript_67704/m.189572 type:complete len:90 (+) Transcript_67704:1000-1269(+)
MQNAPGNQVCGQKRSAKGTRAAPPSEGARQVSEESGGWRARQGSGDSWGRHRVVERDVAEAALDAPQASEDEQNDASSCPGALRRRRDE